jgi:tetratricopeptide (TPR) repeat protein
MPSESDQNKPGQSESFEERIDLLYGELEFASQHQRPSILLVFYQLESVRQRAEQALEKRLVENGQLLVPFCVDASRFDIPLLLSQHPGRERLVFSVTGLARGGGEEGANAYRALNIRREYFVDYAIRVVIWLNDDEAMALSRHAPDFWAFRHRVVEFYDTPDPLELSASTWGWAAQTDDLEEQIGLHEVRLAKLPEGAGSRTEQLELLFRLAGLYRAKKAYDRSIRSLQLGKEIARQLNDIAWLAEIWGKLGLVYLDMDHPLQAVRACRKAVRLDPRKADLWSNLGHFYHVEERYSDAIIAYKRALQLDPQNPSVSSALDACYRWLGKNALAEEQKQLIHK